MLTRIVNFFGHAAVASTVTSEPGALLGAMLPDFATMCRSRLADPEDDAIARGIAHHHATDAAFHHLPAATALMRELDGLLEARGCARGPRRAAAHVGTELLLDGVLVEDRAYRDAYSAALAADPAGVRWRDAEGADRFPVLLARLRAHGVPEDLKSPDAIAERLHRMLAHRPLLAPNGADLAAIRGALAEHQPRVQVATATIMRALVQLA
jgi:hypothetical protein